MLVHHQYEANFLLTETKRRNARVRIDSTTLVVIWLCRKFCSGGREGVVALSVGRLGGQRVEQFGRSEPLVSGLEYHLFFLDHVHEFDSNQGVLRCLERFEP